MKRDQHTPDLFNDLNGWRRIGVVLVVGWLLAASALLFRAPDLSAELLPGLAEPVIGTLSIPAPELKEQLEAAKVKKLGRALMPWEMEWAPTREVPAQVGVEIPLVTRWLLLLAVPFLAWQGIELLVRLVLWVRAGFAGASGC